MSLIFADPIVDSSKAAKIKELQIKSHNYDELPKELPKQYLYSRICGEGVSLTGKYYQN